MTVFTRKFYTNYDYSIEIIAIAFIGTLNELLLKQIEDKKLSHGRHPLK